MSSISVEIRKMEHLYPYVPQLVGRTIPHYMIGSTTVMSVEAWAEGWEVGISYRTTVECDIGFHYGYLTPEMNLGQTHQESGIDFRPALCQIRREHLCRSLPAMRPVLSADLVGYVSKGI